MNEHLTILRCTNIHKTFVSGKRDGSSLHVLKGIDLEVHDGEIITIVGVSGSGKSTFLHILGGLDSPTEGTVYWGEKAIAAFDDNVLALQRASTIGFVFQFHHLLPELTALENVMIPMMIKGVSQSVAADL